MEGVESQSLSQWVDNQISPAISTGLAENVKGFQQCVKEILELIEQEGNFSEITAEIYEDKKSKLTTHVVELSRMHAMFADVSKKQHLESSDSISPKTTQMLTPDQMSNTHNKFRTPVGFDVFSSGGGGSYVSRIEASDSSFSLSSDSDSESFIPINKLLISPVNDDALKVNKTKVPDYETLFQKISNLEEELNSLNKKNQNLTDENTKLKHMIQENELDITTQKADLETEKAKVIDSNLKLSTAEDEISNLKSQLESTQQEIALLQKLLASEKDKSYKLQLEVSIRDDQIMELTTNLNQSMSDIKRVKLEITKKCQLIDDLNKTKDTLKLEKDGVTAHLDTLQAEKCSQDNLIRELKTRLDSLQVDHVRVVSSFDNAQKVANELKREVERQIEVMSDRAEEKREAIRQLSFSLEHYMSRYKEIRQAFVGNKKQQGW